MKFNEKETLWCEKYRPQVIEDCVLSKPLKEAFLGFIEKGDMPNIILHGGPGTGKTTAAKALCKEMGYDYILINASNDRNIDVLRTTITGFASCASFDSDMKVVILDEADFANPNTLQPALRAAIEEFSKTTRFIFTCNYPDRIIKPLHSRCSVFSYDIPKEEKMTLISLFLKRVIAILDNEKILYDKKTIAELILKHYPDYRRILNDLQRYAYVNGTIDENVLKSSKAYNVAELVGYIKNKEFKLMRKWTVENIADKDVNSVFRDFYDNVQEYLIPISIPLMILTIARYQFQGVTCPDPEINFAAFCTELMAEDFQWIA